MKFRSRSLAVLLLLCTLFSLIPFSAISAFAESEETAATSNEAQTVTDDGNELTTKYGTIPEEYADVQAYPFAVFSSGQFIAAYGKLIDNVDNDGITYNGNPGVSSAMEHARAIVYTKGTANAQILMRRDYTYTSSEGSYNNLAQLDGEVTIDLGGYTLNHGKTTSIFLTSAKQSWSKTEGYVVYPAYIKMTNGTLITKSPLVTFATISSANYENCKSSKRIYYTFEDLDIQYQNATYKSLIANCGTSTAVHQRNAFFDVTVNNCTLDITALSSVTVPLASGKDHMGTNLNNLTVNINGGEVKTKNATLGLGAMDEIVGENGDKLILGKGENGYMKFVSTSANAPTVAFPTDRGDATFAKAETVNGANVYALGESTKYGTIPFDYTPEEYPFAVFCDGALVGVSNVWCQDNTQSALFYARSKMAGSKFSKVVVTILVRSDYTTDSKVDNYYNNLAHIGGTLIIDLDGHTFTANGRPMLRAKAQTSGTEFHDSALIIENGTIVNGSNPVLVASTEVVDTRKDYYLRAKNFNFTFNNVDFQMTGNQPVILTNDTATHEYGANFNITFNGCNFDMSKAGSTVALFDGMDSTKLNVTNLVINGGSIVGRRSTNTLFSFDEKDTVKFGTYNGEALTLTVTSGTAPTDVFTSTDGEIVMFRETDIAGKYVMGECIHVYDNNCDINCNVCGKLRLVDDHVYDGEYDTDCNECGARREIDAPATVIASGSCGVNVTWTLSGNGTLTISGNGAMEDYFTVTDQPWQQYMSLINKIVIEDGVTFIGRCAFYGHIWVKEIVLPESLMAIEEYAFFGCTSLTSVTVPAKVFYIGMYAFRKCGLTALTFADQNGWAFTSGNKIDFTDMQKTVAAFTANVTYKQTCLKTVEDAGEVIAEGTFGNKSQFSWTLTDTGVLTVSGNGAMPKFNVNTTPWYGYRGAIRTVIIEEGITSVGRCSFHTCRAIVSVTLPESLETIAEYAFYNCPNLTSVTVPASVTRIEIFAFRKCFTLSDVTFTVPYGWSTADGKLSATEISANANDMLTLAYYTDVWTRDVNAEEETIDPNYMIGGMCNTNIKWTLTYTDEAKTKTKLTVSGIGAMPKFETAGAPWYEYMSSIVEIEVTAGITEIGRCSFYGLKFVKTVTLAEGITSINDYAFNGCFSLKNIDLPGSVTHIGKDAFAKTGLTPNYTAPELFDEILSIEGGAKIKLLGDSITHGVSGTGFAQNGEHITGKYYRNPDGYCWANLLADYMSETYGCEVVNNACTGTKIEFIISNFDTLVDDDDDLVIVMIGTNNRQQYMSTGERIDKETYLDQFYHNVIKLNKMFEDAGKRVIFVANIPASEKNEQDGSDYWRIFHMDDVNATYKKASAELGFAMVSMYDLFTAYLEENGITLDSMLKDGLHPNDEGYTVMFELFKEAFGI